MMENLRTSLLSVSLLLGSTALTSTSVLAGGLINLPGGMKDTVIQDPGAIPVPAPVPIPETANWYIRGDIGVGWHGGAEASLSGRNGTEAVSEFTAGDSFNMGFGIGYYFSKRLRADLTLDYKSEVETRGDSWVSTASNAGPDLESTLLLTNFYLDFRPSSMVSPYLGVGVGMSFNSMKGPDGSYQVTDNNGNVLSVTHRANSTNEFAVAAMAGANVALRHGLYMNLGYRYLYHGDTNSSYEVDVTTPLGASYSTTEQFDLNELSSHEFRVGLRYDFY